MSFLKTHSTSVDVLNGRIEGIEFFLENLIHFQNKILEENRCKFYECEVPVHVNDKHEISLVCS